MDHNKPIDLMDTNSIMITKKHSLENKNISKGKRKYTPEEQERRNVRKKIRRLKDAAEKPVSISMKRKRKKSHTHIVRNNARRKIRQESVLKGYETLKKDENGYLDFGGLTIECEYCKAEHFFYERLLASTKNKHIMPDLCCQKGAYVPNIPEAPDILKDLLTDQTSRGTHFRKNIRKYNSAFALSSVQANWVSRGLGSSKWNPTLTAQGKMYHLIGALNPPPNGEPKFASLYVYDTEHSVANRKKLFSGLKDDILIRIEKLLLENNALVKQFVSLNDRIKSGSIPEDVGIVIHAHKKNSGDHDRKYNLPEASEVALIVTNEQCGPIDIKLRYRGTLNENGNEKLMSIHLGHPVYDPAAFPLLFPYGNDGWHIELRYTTKAKTKGTSGKELKVSPLKFYGRYLFTRKGTFSILLHSCRLFQQYLTEAFYKIENERLSYLRAKNDNFRSMEFNKLQERIGDAITSGNEIDMVRGNTDMGNVVILPPSHIGGERYMKRKMHDIIALSNKIGHPDIFLTFTCNPNWTEIQSALLPGQKAEDRPDICNRVFHMKQQHLIKYLKSGKPFGEVAAFASVIEFQKRGLAHSHIIIILSSAAKLKISQPENVDKIICAEIPSENSNFRKTVLDHMIHRPCQDDPKARCLNKETGQCSKRYPKKYKQETSALEGDYYMSYRRRSPDFGGETDKLELTKGKMTTKIPIDNSWVVPYCPELLSMYKCHMNVELCISRVGSIKYLFKYICKGPDRISVEIQGKRPAGGPLNSGADEPRDEISLFQDARYYSASESAWRLFAFPMVEHYPPVERMAVHLKDQQKVYFKKGEQLIAAHKNDATHLMAWFDANNKYHSARHILFMDYPKYFTWHTGSRQWKPRANIPYRKTVSGDIELDFSGNGEAKVGRMYGVSPRDRERYYLRTLLLHKSGGLSFEDMRTIDGVLYDSYQSACMAMGLLADDAEWNRCLSDAYENAFEPLTSVFATILAYCEPSNPKAIWNKHIDAFLDDIHRRNTEIFAELNISNDDNARIQYALLEIRDYLAEMKFNYDDFGLPQISDDLPSLDRPSHEIEPSADSIIATIEKSTQYFNQEQKHVFNTIVGEVLPGTTADDIFSPVKFLRKLKNQPRAYLLDAPGGTGKTFVMRAIHALLKLREKKIITVASSAVAASLLDGGRTAHSTFKIPIPCFEDSVCRISMDSKLALEIREADLIMWDEIVMANRTNIEAVDRTLRTIMNQEHLMFGGKLLLFSGDFRQILPVVPKGSRGMIVNACLKSSKLFPSLLPLKLTTNMRLQSLMKDPNADRGALGYPQYLLDVGEGNLESDENGLIMVAGSINVVSSTDELVESVFNNLEANGVDEEWMTSRAILATTNARLHELNEVIGNRFPGKYRYFLSADTVTSDDDLNTKSLELKYPQELLNSMPGNASLPDHRLLLKPGFIVMLLRNIRPLQGHVNGTRYIVENMTKNILFLKAVSGSHPGKKFVLPRLNCIPGKDDYPIPGFRRRQFPVRVCFSMTINKSQGQSISGKLGVDLSSDCFSHGQLYVALSRTTDPRNVYVMLNEDNCKAKNVVYEEVINGQKQGKNQKGKARKENSVLKRDCILRAQSNQHKTLIVSQESSVAQEGKLNDFEVTELSDTEEPSKAIQCAGVPVYPEDLRLVKGPRTWLNANSIDAMMALMAPVGIYGLPAVVSNYLGAHGLDTLRPQEKLTVLANMNKCHTILAPLNEHAQHWGLAILEKRSSTIYVYDSIHDFAHFTRELNGIQKWCNEAKKTYDVLQNWPNCWKIQRTKRSPQQSNSYDCGVFTIMNSFYYTQGIPNPGYSQQNISEYRNKIYDAIRHQDISRLTLD